MPRGAPRAQLLGAALYLFMATGTIVAATEPLTGGTDDSPQARTARAQQLAEERAKVSLVSVRADLDATLLALTACVADLAPGRQRIYQGIIAVIRKLAADAQVKDAAGRHVTALQMLWQAVALGKESLDRCHRPVVSPQPTGAAPIR